MENHNFSDWVSVGLLQRERKCHCCGLVDYSFLGDGGLHWFGWNGVTKAPWPRKAPSCKTSNSSETVQ
jgi:hypothetical protein